MILLRLRWCTLWKPNKLGEGKSAEKKSDLWCYTHIKRGIVEKFGSFISLGSVGQVERGCSPRYPFYLFTVFNQIIVSGVLYVGPGAVFLGSWILRLALLSEFFSRGHH
jgi:hypothetical protein